jgi:Ca2+-binding EF-hand superfamily protein
MSLSDFQQMKMGRMFDIYDLNADGRIEESDFTRRAHSFARERGWDEESPRFREQLDFTLADWQNLQQAADSDGDGSVTRDEFLDFAQVMLNDSEALEQYAYMDADLIFRAMDSDGDGRITADEYGMYLRAYRIDDSMGADFFDQIDRDRDGFVTRDEILGALKDFLFSDDTSAPGNYLFGPLDMRIGRD